MPEIELIHIALSEMASKIGDINDKRAESHEVPIHIVAVYNMLNQFSYVLNTWEQEIPIVPSNMGAVEGKVI